MLRDLDQLIPVFIDTQSGIYKLEWMD